MELLVPNNTVLTSHVIHYDSSESEDEGGTDAIEYAEKHFDESKEIVPQLFCMNMEKYLRGSQELPEDYIQTSFDETAEVTRKELSDSISEERMHLMAVGAVGAGKSSLILRIANDLAAKKMIMCIINLRCINADEKLSLKDLIFHDVVKTVTDESKTKSLEWALGSSERLVFVADSLDSVPYDFESPEYERTNIDPLEKLSPQILAYNLFAGNVFPKAKILSACRHSCLLPPSENLDRTRSWKLEN